MVQKMKQILEHPWALFIGNLVFAMFFFGLSGSMAHGIAAINLTVAIFILAQNIKRLKDKVKPEN